MKTKISIIIPVYQEKENISGLIEHLINLNSPITREIIVVDGDRAGSTINQIHDDKIIKVLSLKGRALQMNTGAKQATGDILLFLHADTKLPDDSLLDISETINIKKYSAGAFDLGINSKKKIYRMIENISSLRSRITRTPYGDQAQFFKRDYFFELGMFQEVPLMEDVEIMERIKKRKEKIHIIKSRVKSSARRWEKEGILYCTLRNWFLISLYSLGVKPDKLKRFYL